MGSLSLVVNMLTPLLITGLVSAAHAQYAGCPEPFGLQVYPHEQYCDKFYKCANGTLTEEVCENGLVFDGYADVHNHCNYNSAVDCGSRTYNDTTISSPGCLYAYGIYPVGEGCQTTFFKCADGVAYETPCKRGLAYTAEKHVCDYPDNVYDCKGKSETVTGFKCPSPDELPPNAVARRFLPYPRFPMPGDEYAYIVCVADQPRIQYCGEGSVFDPATLGCVYYEDPHAAGPYPPGPF